jgi:radical SAM protein with 4Fe4S-binding SPASM domain
MMIWEVPPWVSSRSYALGTPLARSIVTNARWWSNIVLDGMSVELWAALPRRFCFEDLAERLHTIGMDIWEADARSEVRGFLETLRGEGLLTITGSENPQPNYATQNEGMSGGIRQLTSVEMDFNDWLLKQGKLPSAFIELTYRCNQRCVHCFNPGAAHTPNEQPDRNTNELTTKKVLGVLADLADLGVYTLTFSGGEVSLRDDLFDILQEAKRLGFSFNLFTNGQVPESLVEKICSLWPRTLGVSLYSANPETHDATTGINGSFSRAVKTLRTASAAGIRTTVKCPLMRHTVAGYKLLLDLCDQLNALPQFDLHISAGMDGNRSGTIHQITDEKTLALVMRDPRIAMYVGLDVPNAGRGHKAVDGRACGAGMYSLSIAPDGTVYPCNSLPLPVGNIHSSSIREIWEHSPALRSWNSVVLSDFDECGMYARCGYCNFCPGMAATENGKWFAAPKTCCLTAQVRMETSNSLLAGHDPLAEQPKADWGYDHQVQSPSSHCHFDMAVATNGDVHRDPRTISGHEYVHLVECIHRQGNVHRKAKSPEVNSPEAEQLHRTDLVDHYVEFGR